MIYLESVTKSFNDGKNRVEVLHPVTLHVNRGSFVAIVGPSGSGKSTLLTIMGALQNRHKVLLPSIIINFHT